MVMAIVMSDALRIVVVGAANSIHVARWLRFLVGRGHHVVLLSDELPHNDTPARTIVLPARGLPRPLRHLLGGWRLRRLVRRCGADLVHLQSVGSNALLAPFAPSQKLVITPWGTEVLGRKGWGQRVLIGWALRRAALVLTTSHSMAEQVAMHGVPVDRIATISWGIDLTHGLLEDPEPDDRLRLGIPADAAVVTSARPIAPVYRTLEIARAFVAAMEQQPKLHLVLFRGWSPRRSSVARVKNSYEAQVIALLTRSATGRYTFIPRPLTPDEMVRLLRCSDAAVSIPTTDQRSTTILEALAARAWVIGSAIPPYRELVEDGYALTLLDEPIIPALASTLRGLRSVTADQREANQGLIRHAESANDQLRKIEDELRVVARSPSATRS